MSSNTRFEYVYLGQSGLKVSNMCLGAAIFGDRSDRGCNEETSTTILNKFTEYGGNFIDTADWYQHGTSEQIIGNWLTTQKRDDLVIGTKCCFSMDGSKPNQRGLSRKHITSSIQGSLERLKTNYIDIYQMHGWDSGTSLEETLRTFNDLVRQGKVMYLGTSNVTGWQLQKITDYCKFMGLEPIVTAQMHYCLLSRHIEYEVTDVCKTEGISLMPWSPLKGGWLSGKIRRGTAEPPSGSRVAWSQEDASRKVAASQPDWDTFANADRTWQILDTVEGIAAEQSRSMAQVSLRWLLQRPPVTSVVIGAKNLAQLEDNTAAATGWSLTQQQMDKLDSASSIDTSIYPYEMMNRMQQGRHRPS